MGVRQTTRRATSCACRAIRHRRIRSTFWHGDQPPSQCLRWFRLAGGAPRTDPRAIDLRRMILLDTNALFDLMKPAPSQPSWAGSTPSLLPPCSCQLSPGRILYSVALLPEDKRREGWHGPRAPRSRLIFTGGLCPSTRKLPRRSLRWLPSAARAGRPISKADAQIAPIAVPQCGSCRLRRAGF
jgi:predicted nucleic acid-binding protein